MKQGDRKAGDALFSKYIPVIHGTLYHTVEGAQEQDVEDLTKSVCLTILEELNKYNPEFAVSTWVNNLIRRHRTGFRRRQEKHQDTHLSLDESKDPRSPDGRPLSETLAGDGPDALRVLEEKEKAAQAKLLIRRFLATLETEKDREVFIDQKLSRLSYAEIAKKHDLTLDAVKGRLKRTRQKWVAFLKEHQSID
jgi:RNA polymerase sigma factor (sigma-70 family)